MTRRLVFLLSLTWTLIAPAVVLAQQGADTAQVDAIRCWRRVSTNAVYVGERFTMDVTCSVVETDTARTLPDQAALEPETIDVAPFEVLAGEHFEDIRAGPYRFFQYRYTLRVINESTFGEDVELASSIAQLTRQRWRSAAPMRYATDLLATLRVKDGGGQLR